MSIEVMKQALEALDGLYEPGELERVNKAITTLRTAIEQAEKQKPVAWRAKDANGRWMYGDVPAPELPSGQAEFLGVIATPAAPVQDIEHCIWARNGNTPCPHTAAPVQELAKEYVCKVCKGTGEVLGWRCVACKPAPVQEPSTRACRSCGGSGERDTGIAESPTAICKPCSGTGQITTPPAAPCNPRTRRCVRGVCEGV